jgi:hypothetical protein
MRDSFLMAKDVMMMHLAFFDEEENRLFVNNRAMGAFIRLGVYDIPHCLDVIKEPSIPRWRDI